MSLMLRLLVPYKEDEAHINWAGPMCDATTIEKTSTTLEKLLLTRSLDWL